MNMFNKLGLGGLYERRSKREEQRIRKNRNGCFIYRVSLSDGKGLCHVEDVTCKTPSDAMYEVIKKLYDMNVYAVDYYELKHKLDINRIANAKVEKLTGAKITVHYYRVNVDTIENKRERQKAQQEIEYAERRGHYQNIV